MKSKVIMAIIGLFLCCHISGAEAANKVEWGMKISIDAELPGKWKGEYASFTMFRPGIGTSIGAVAHVALGKNFYFAPEFNLFYSGYKYKDLFITGSDGNVLEKDPKVTKWGFRIPLLVGYGIRISDSFELDVFTGPQMGYAFAGKIDIKSKALKEDTEDTFDLWGKEGQRRFDCSWKIGVGVPVRDCLLSIEADLGMTDLLKGKISFRENRLGLGFTKFF